MSIPESLLFTASRSMHKGVKVYCYGLNDREGNYITIELVEDSEYEIPSIELTKNEALQLADALQKIILFLQNNA